MWIWLIIFSFRNTIAKNYLVILSLDFLRYKIMYAVVDIETTGGRAGFHRITEIAIFIHDGEKVVDSFETLINPESFVPPKITALTGITNDMVSDAPRFHEVAKHVYTLTEGKIFVAHNVNFDYAFLKEEFLALGAQFTRKKLCTVRLSRKLFPGFPSYSLGNLCDKLNVSINNRHRAAGDAAATAEVLTMLLRKDCDGHINQALKRNSYEATLPPNLPKEQYDALPESTGVYYFLDKNSKVLYVGKAKNIKKRVAGHFSGETSKKQLFVQNIYGISYEVCGNELVALLHESNEIKKHWPPYNRAQKKPGTNYGLYQYEDKAGFLRWEISKANKLLNPVHTFVTLSEARTFVMTKVKNFELCPKLCGLQRTPAACFDHFAGLCNGACAGKETPALYNHKVVTAVESLPETSKSLAIIGKGRTFDESSVVLVEHGKYIGYGYLLQENGYDDYESIRSCITRCKDNPDVLQIINAHIRKNTSDRILRFNI